MSSRLERRYRLLLRVLPAWYRAEREEEMLGVFLLDRTDELDLEYGWPGWAETWPMLALAIRTRIDGPPRVAAVGDLVRMIAVIGLFVQSVFLVGAVVSLALNSMLRAQMTPDQYYLHIVNAIMPVAAFVALMTGRRVLARVFAGVAVVPSLIAVGSALRPHDMVALELWSVVMVSAPLWISVACLIVGYHGEAPVPPATPWLRALVLCSGITVAFVATMAVVPMYPSEWWAVFNPIALMDWGVLAAGIVLLVKRSSRTGVYVLALAICAATLLPERLIMLVYFTTATSVAQVIGTVAVTVVLAVLGVRGFQQFAVSEPGVS